MATNHQVVEEALDAKARQVTDRLARCPQCVDVEPLSAEELEELAAGPPGALALMDRCYGCDSRSAELVGGMCPTCRAERRVA